MKVGIHIADPYLFGTEVMLLSSCCLSTVALLVRKVLIFTSGGNCFEEIVGFVEHCCVSTLALLV